MFGPMTVDFRKSAEFEKQFFAPEMVARVLEERVEGAAESRRFFPRRDAGIDLVQEFDQNPMIGIHEIDTERQILRPCDESHLCILVMLVMR